MELRFSPWRRDLWSRVEGPRVLELGAGTGKNLRFYPLGADVTLTDFSPRMLERARRKAAKLGKAPRIEVADAQHLQYEDGCFDTVIATFLFCSVPDALRGLSEARRVLKPGGQLLLLEHVLSKIPVLHSLMKWFDFVPFYVWGAHMNRDTVSTVRKAGFTQIGIENKSLDIVKAISARS